MTGTDIEQDFSPAHNRFPGPGASPAGMWRMLDLITPMALRVAATLRLADRLTGGPLPIAELAEQAGADAPTLRRLVRYLAARGVFETEEQVATVALNPAAELLLDGHPAGIRRWTDLDGFGGVLDGAGLELLGIVRSGRPAEGGHRNALDGERGASYDSAMQAMSRMQAPDVVAAIDWVGVGHVVDVGGGTGTLLAAALHTVSQLRGTLVELPGAADAAREVLDVEGLSERATVLGGDAAQVCLPAADLYLLKFVTHTMDDNEAQAVLRRCADSGGQGCRVLLVERVESPADPGAAVFTSMDLRMLALGGGRERTAAEYDDLAASAGLERVSVRHTASGPSVLEYRHQNR